MIAAVRKARPGDAKSIAVLGSSAWIDTYATGGLRDAFAHYVLTQFSQTRIEEVLASRNVIVAEVSDHLVGYAVLVDGKDGTEIDNFYILPRFQKRGIGKKMIAHILQEHSQVWLVIPPETHRAHK